MNVELRNHWVTMCLLPYKVKPHLRNKFVACLIGDEMASDKEFAEMADDGVRVGRTACSGCKFRYQGSCFHPFRPGDMVSAIFTSVMRGQHNAQELVDEKVEGYLDNRSCDWCSMACSQEMLWNSAFSGLNKLYDQMFDNVKHGTFYCKWQEFRSRYKSVIDDVPYFESGEYSEYEDNIRSHFDRMAERHYNELKAALAAPWKEHKEAVAKALSKVRFELVTHFMNYWEARLFEKTDA